MTPIHFPLTPEWLWWRYPWVLLLLLLIPLWLALQARPQRHTVVRFSSLDHIRAARLGLSHRLRSALSILRVVALAALIIACARPQIPDQTSQRFAEGVAIQLVVDVSGSMRDTDLAPRSARAATRLDVVKAVVNRFVAGDEDRLAGRPDDLVGLIRFARYPDSVCPLTLDHDNLLTSLKHTQVTNNPDEDGTAIGDALGLAVERLRDLKRTAGSGTTLKIVSRVVILLTDGENNLGVVTPEQAGDLAAREGIKVYTILAGTGQLVGTGFRAPVNDTELRHIADVSGGRHFRAQDVASLMQVYEEIDSLERSRVEERSYLRWGELSMPWLMLAFGSLGLLMFMDSTFLRKVG